MGGFFTLWILLLGLLFLLCGSATGRGKRVKSKVIKQGKANCLDVDNKPATISLKCRSKRDIIYHLDISSSTSRCGQSGQCSGLQPNVLTRANMCYWNRNCTIGYSSESPIVRTEDFGCIGRYPTSLDVQYLCIKKRNVIFLHKTSKALDTNVSKTADFGMLVSHTDYPWHYKPGTTATLSLKPKSRKVTKLYLTVKDVEMNMPEDISRFEEGTKWHHISEKDNIYIRARATRFQLLTNKASSAAPGFVACFYWAEECESLSEEDICKKVIRLKRRPKRPCRKRRKSKQP